MLKGIQKERNPGERSSLLTMGASQSERSFSEDGSSTAHGEVRMREICARWLSCQVCAFLLPLLVINCQGVEDNSARVALYCDRGADEGCIKATQNMFEWMGYSVQLVKADYFNSAHPCDCSILCFPGGDMYQYAQDISQDGKEKIRSFIRNGGAYIGICGGSYFTASDVIWQGTRLPMNPLGLFPGEARGPVDAIAPYPQCTMCRINIVNSTHPITQSETDTTWILYCYGPMFSPDDGADIVILGQYDIGGQPAVAAFEYGLGRVFIIGAHPEFEEDRDRDGFPADDGYDDMGSDWDLMKNAVLWCLGEH